MPDLASYEWAVPPELEIPPDILRARLDFYQDSIVLYLIERATTTTKMVSAREVITALLSTVPLGSGLLPPDALWWKQGNIGTEVGLWVPPKVWMLALQTQPMKPPERFKIPMPGLIFGCIAARAPRVFAAKKRPVSPSDIVYHAPLFNVYNNGESCAGTHKYPSILEEIPKSFMVSFFTGSAHFSGRSQKYPSDLLDLWRELDAAKAKKYPLDDLVKVGTVEDVMNAKRLHT